MSSKSHEFYMDVLDDLQGRLRNSDRQFSILAIALQNRNLEGDELEQEKLESLFKKNRNLIDEEFKHDMEDKNILEIYRLMEESFTEKSKILKLKRQFVDNIRKMKDSQQNELEKVFESLNAVEDEYAVVERVLSNLQTAIFQNKEENESIKKQIEFSQEKKKEFEDIIEDLKTQKTELESQKSILENKVSDFKSQIEQEEENAKNKKIESAELKAKLVCERLLLFEHNEKQSFLQKAISNIEKELSQVSSLKAEAQSKSDSLIQDLKEKITKNQLEGSALKKAQDLLSVIEKGGNNKFSFCDLDEGLKSSINELILTSHNQAKEKMTFGLCEQQVIDFISQKDVNLLGWLVSVLELYGNLAHVSKGKSKWYI